MWENCIERIYEKETSECENDSWCFIEQKNAN
jgi:hypothetical protein